MTAYEERTSYHSAADIVQAFREEWKGLSKIEKIIKIIKANFKIELSNFCNSLYSS
jgi:hypothetical protein